MLIRDQAHRAATLAMTCAFSGILVLTGCSSMGEKERCSTDWRMIGYEDAVTGQMVTQLTDHQTACPIYDITPNLDLYQLGYAEGLKEYCCPSIVFQLGRDGSAYPSQCPDNLTDQLKISYRYGLDIYNLNDDIKNMQKLLSHKKNELKQAEKVLSEYNTEIDTQDTLASHGIEILEEDMELPKHIDGIKDEINNLNFKLTSRQTQLKRLVSVLQ